MANWGCCMEGNNNDEKFITCRKCIKDYHIGCLQSSDKYVTDDFSDNNWKCPLCRSGKGNGPRHDETPLRQSDTAKKDANTRSHKRQALGSPSPSQKSPSPSINQTLTSGDIRGIIREEMTEMFGKMNNALCAITSEVKTIKTDISEIKDSLNYVNQQYEDVMCELQLTKDKVKSLEKEKDEMRGTISNLNQRLNNLEQHSRTNNVEIQCIPDNRNENLLALVKNIASVTGCAIKDDQVVLCTRIAKIDRTSMRPRSVIVQFCTSNIRNYFMAGIYKYNRLHQHDKINTSHLGIQGEKKQIYVMEHLSPANKQLHAAARARAKELGYKYVWTRGGRVYMRRDDTSDYILIRDIESLENLK